MTLNNENKEELELGFLNRKAKFFFDSKTKVHLKLKSGFFKNGYITEIGTDFFFLDDLVRGNVVVFFLEVLDIEAYMERQGENK